MVVTKNKELFQKVKNVRKEIHNNIDEYSEKEINQKIIEVNDLLNELKDLKKKSFFEKNRYKMRNLYMRKEI